MLTGVNTYTGLTTVKSGTLDLGVFAQSPVLTGGGADIQSQTAKLVFDYGGTSPFSTIKLLLNNTIYASGAGVNPLIAIDNLMGQVTVESTVSGDANLDGTVNGADLNTVLAHYNQTGMSWSLGDFDGNGTVNGADLNTVLAHYNQHLSVGVAVPEPSALALFGVGAIGLLGYLRRRRKAS